tara:strand:+ start:2709 stop:3098 length:390 start_codon:yes stop_codon:yes gene_type:complete
MENKEKDPNVVDSVINKKAQKSIKIIEKLLREMHKDIRDLIDLENLDKSTEVIKQKSVRITKICVALQSTLDHENGGIVAHHLDHLYKHIRYAVHRVRDEHDFTFLHSAEKVTAEINEGWQKISESAAA